MDVLRIILEYFGGSLLQLLAAALTPLGLYAIRKWAKSQGIKRTQEAEAMWERVVDEGISFANRQAETWIKTGQPVSGHEKLRHALRFASQRAEEYQLPEKSEAWLESLVEARLGDPRGPDKKIGKGQEKS